MTSFVFSPQFCCEFEKKRFSHNLAPAFFCYVDRPVNLVFLFVGAYSIPHHVAAAVCTHHRGPCTIPA